MSKQNKMMKTQMAFAREQATKNYNNAVKSYNTNLEDKYDRRVSNSGGSNEIVNGRDDYMKKHRIG